MRVLKFNPILYLQCSYIASFFYFAYTISIARLAHVSKLISTSLILYRS